MTGRAGPDAGLRVGERVVRVSNLDRVVWPRAGFTKQQMIDFYLDVADALLPHVRARPLTLKRAPEGVDGQWWYQTQCPHPPSWMPTVPVRNAKADRVWDYCTANEPAALVWLANMGCVELHPLLFCARTERTPRELVFDLDPGPGAGIIDCCRVALLVRDELARCSLRAFVKTSGLAGLHLHAPLTEPCSFEETKRFARHVARNLAAERPADIVAVRRRSARTSRVLIDWSQNDRYASVVAPYSLRVAALPLVATPLQWDEVRRSLDRRDQDGLVFMPDRVVERLGAGIDPFAEAPYVRQELPRA